MSKLYYKNKAPNDEEKINGITDFINLTIYVDKELDGFLLVKTLRHELTHIYLWETGQQYRIMNEEEICDFMSVAAPAVCKTVDMIILRLREGLYKKGD